MATPKKQSVLLRRRRSSWHNRFNGINFEPEHLLSTSGAPLPLRTVKQLLNAVPRALCRVIVDTGDGGRSVVGGLISSGTGMLVKLPPLNNEDGGRHYCGLLTNNHVLDESSVRQRRWRLVFDETGARVDPDNPKLGPVLFGSSRTLDFTFLYLPDCKLFKLEDFLPVAPEKNGTRVIVVQHPNGGELSLSYGEIVGLSGPDMYHTADTMGGSSGSPLLDQFGRVVGLHKAGSPLTNVATRMTYITQALAQSSALMTDFRRGGSEKRKSKTTLEGRAPSPPPPYSPGPSAPPQPRPIYPTAPDPPPLLYRCRPGARGFGWGGRKVGVEGDTNFRTLLFCQFPLRATAGGCGRPSSIRDLEMFEYELSRLVLADRLLLPRVNPGGSLLADQDCDPTVSDSEEDGAREDSSDADNGQMLERATSTRIPMSKRERRFCY